MSTFEIHNKILEYAIGPNLALFKKIWGQNPGRVKRDHSLHDEVWATSPKLGTKALSYQMLNKYPDFLCKCQI